VLEEIRENWALIGAFVVGILAWGETRITATAAKKLADQATEDTGELKTAVAVLKTHAEYTVRGIDEIKEAIKKPVSERS
jgi:hypothetical protein